MNNKLIVALVMASCLGLSACDKAKEVVSKAESEATKTMNDVKDAATSAVSGEEGISQKVNQYTRISNQLQSYYHPSNETFAEWQAKDQAKARAGDYKAISSKTYIFENAVRDFEKALAMPGSLPEVDKAAQTYLDTIKAAMPTWQELIAYNKAKKYEDDKGAKGKELLVTYNADQDKLAAAHQAFDKVFQVALAEEKVKRIAQFKAKGQLLELHTNLALEKASEMLGVFNDFKDFKDQAKLDKANALLGELESELEAMNKAYEQRKTESDKVDSDWQRVHSTLISFTGEYREARKDPKRYNKMVNEYNDAVDKYNRIRH